MQDRRKANQNHKNFEQICEPSIARKSIDQIEENCCNYDYEPAR